MRVLAKTYSQVVSHSWSADFGEIGGREYAFIQQIDQGRSCMVPLAFLSDFQTSAATHSYVGPYHTEFAQTLTVIPADSGPVPVALDNAERYEIRQGRDLVLAVPAAGMDDFLAFLSDAHTWLLSGLAVNAWDATPELSDSRRSFYPGLKFPGSPSSVPGMR